MFEERPAPFTLGTDTRAVLGLLSQFAEKTGVAVLAVTHLNQGEGDALSRVQGSVAFTAAPRAVWSLTRDPERADARLLLNVKNNVGGDQSALRPDEPQSDDPADPAATPRLHWDAEPVEMRADHALLADAPPPPAAPRAESFLRRVLADGPLPVADLREKAAAENVS